MLKAIDFCAAKNMEHHSGEIKPLISKDSSCQYSFASYLCKRIHIGFNRPDFQNHICNYRPAPQSHMHCTVSVTIKIIRVWFSTCGMPKPAGFGLLDLHCPILTPHHNILFRTAETLSMARRVPEVSLQCCCTFYCTHYTAVHSVLNFTPKGFKLTLNTIYCTCYHFYTHK